MSYEPCLNPNCKSYGKPHPNCRCHGSFASGGKVEHFCSKAQLHQKDCKYFAEGGEVSPFTIPQHDDPEMSVVSYLGHGGLHGLLQMGSKASDQSIEKYNRAIKHGSKNLSTRINDLFKDSPSEKVDHTESKKLINDWIEKGGVNHDLQQEIYKQQEPQNFAEGGHVKQTQSLLHDSQIASAYPAQNMMLQTAKGRTSNYLGSLKPQKNTPKLAFDHEPDTRQQEKSYQSALHMAADPFHVLSKVQNGTIQPEDIKHLQNLYPEVNSVLQKKLTEKITEAQMKKEKPSYKVRQGLSLLMGVPLSAEMTPQNIQAAQATFQMGKPQQQEAPTKGKKNTSTLTKADDAYLTSPQARVAREQKQ